MDSLPEDQTADTYVSTPQELQQAITEGVRDVVIKNHLDVSGLLPAPSHTCADAGCSPHLVIHPLTRMIRGNCTGSPPSPEALQLTGPSLLPRKEGQCLIVVEQSALDLQGQDAWLDNLYFRVRSNPAGALSTVLTAHSSARLWMTDVTFQGDSSPNSQALLATDAEGAFAQGCMFSHFGGQTSALYSRATPLTFEDCTFDSNLGEQPNNTVAVVSAGNAAAGVMLERSLFGNSNSLLLRSRHGARVYSDDSSLQYYDADMDARLPVSSPSEVVPGTFLNASDPWFVSLQQEKLSAQPVQRGGIMEQEYPILENTVPSPPPPEIDVGPRSSSKPDKMTISEPQLIGIVAACLLVVMLLCTCTWLFKRWRKKVKKPVYGAATYASGVPGPSSIFVQPNINDDTESLALEKLEKHALSSPTKPHAFADTAMLTTEVDPSIMFQTPGSFFNSYQDAPPAAHQSESSQAAPNSLSITDSRCSDALGESSPPLVDSGMHASASLMAPDNLRKHKHADPPSRGGSPEITALPPLPTSSREGHAYDSQPSSADSEKQTLCTRLSSGTVTPLLQGLGARSSSYNQPHLTQSTCSATSSAAGAGLVRINATSEASTRHMHTSHAYSTLGQYQTRSLHVAGRASPPLSETAGVGWMRLGSTDGSLRAPLSNGGPPTGARRVSSGDVASMGGMWMQEFVNQAFNTEACMEPPAAGESPEQHNAWLHHQLDGFDASSLLLGKYESLGPTARRQGGSGIVQFVRNDMNGREYAIKFFTMGKAFEAEQRVYAKSPLQGFLPAVEVYDGNTWMDTKGQALPPCIVMERGESLSDWSQASKPDLSTSVTVLANVAAYIHGIHTQGYTHRNIKPSNVVWLPHENKWVTLDVVSVRRMGSTCMQEVALAYAAPEVVEAMESSCKLVASAAQDMWALGVIAFELLTGTAAFPLPFLSKADVIAQLRDEQPLPWIEGCLSPEGRASIGGLYGPLMQLLDRDPQRRPTAAQFCDYCMALASSNTTVVVNQIGGASQLDEDDDGLALN